MSLTHPLPNQHRHPELVSGSRLVKWLIAAVLAPWALLAAPTAMAKDALCAQLNNFVAAQEAETSNPMPRHWVEFHWGIDTYPNTIWSWGCRHSVDQSSNALCDYLKDNVSREFRNLLPIRIMQCMGYRFPSQANSGWHMQDGRVEHQRNDGSWLVLDIVTAGLQPGESAVRVSYDTVDRALNPTELEPVQPLHVGDDFKLP